MQIEGDQGKDGSHVQIQHCTAGKNTNFERRRRRLTILPNPSTQLTCSFVSKHKNKIVWPETVHVKRASDNWNNKHFADFEKS